MTLLEQIRTEAVGNDTDLAVILRKCRVLAQRLENEEFKKWVDFELGGYPANDAVPKYRVLDCFCYGKFRHMSNGSESGSIQIPISTIPQQYRKTLFTMPFSDGVSVLQNLVNRTTNENIQTGWEADFCGLVGRGIFPNWELLSAWRLYPAVRVVGLLDSVRNRILNFVLEIEKENPNAGEAIMTSAPIPSRRIEQIFHTHIAGHVGNMAVGSHLSSPGLPEPRTSSAGVQPSERPSQQKLPASRWEWFLKPSRLVFVFLTALLVPIAAIYFQSTEPDLIKVGGVPVPKSGRVDPSTNSARLLLEVDVPIKNRSVKSGHIERVEIRPARFDQPVEVEVRYVDRRPIGWLETKSLKFQFVQTVRHTGADSFIATFFDNNGKQIYEETLGGYVWTEGQPAPPNVTIPPAD